MKAGEGWGRVPGWGRGVGGAPGGGGTNRRRFTPFRCAFYPTSSPADANVCRSLALLTRPSLQEQSHPGLVLAAAAPTSTCRFQGAPCLCVSMETHLQRGELLGSKLGFSPLIRGASQLEEVVFSMMMSHSSLNLAPKLAVNSSETR